MTRRDWLLLLIAMDGDDEGLDPIRVQKAMFLFAEEGGRPVGERYAFVAYNYGPMSPGLYRDVEALVRRGLIERREVDGYRWHRLRATVAGHQRAGDRLCAVSGDEAVAAARLREMRRTVQALDFTGLLETIYDRYPRFAQRSVFRRRP
ncbi:MAG: hypothetical protein ACRDPC_01175 [Solirubrobacteraceae bacterium]